MSIVVLVVVEISCGKSKRIDDVAVLVERKKM
jgi:hypothetical protein